VGGVPPSHNLNGVLLATPTMEIARLAANPEGGELSHSCKFDAYSLLLDSPSAVLMRNQIIPAICELKNLVTIRVHTIIGDGLPLPIDDFAQWDKTLRTIRYQYAYRPPSFPWNDTFCSAFHIRPRSSYWTECLEKAPAALDDLSPPEFAIELGDQASRQGRKNPWGEGEKDAWTKEHMERASEAPLALGPEDLLVKVSGVSRV
jgi:hypothetical protein